MTMGVFDFKSIRRSLERQEQKAEFEEKSPKPLDAAPIVWTPEWGYGTPVPLVESTPQPDWSEFWKGATFEIPDLRGRIKANG